MDGDVVGEAALAGDYYGVAVVDAGDEFVAVAKALAEFDFLIGHAAVGVCVDVFVAGAGLLHDCAVGDYDIVLGAHVESYTGKHAGLYAFAGIGYADFGHEGACGCVDGGVDAVDGSFEGFIGECVESNCYGHAFAHECHVVLAYSDEHFHDR